MLHRSTLAAAAALFVSAPLFAQSALDTARIDVVEGRAVLIGGGADVQTLRRTETFQAEGRSQVELSAGSRVHIAWNGTMGMDVHGPASFEWSATGDRVTIDFGELAWADVEARRGEHTIELPADWRATVGRSSLHLRGVAGGPTEVRLDAGQPVVVDWRGGGDTIVRPPVAVYPGSSVRLDRPQHSNVETQRPGRDLSWSAPEREATRDTWPWRASGGGDTAAEIAERDALARQTQDFDEVPGAPEGSIGRVRTYGTDGSSRTVDLPRYSRTERSTGTVAQAPVAPATRPEVEVQPRTEQSQRTLSRDPFAPEDATETRGMDVERSRPTTPAPSMQPTRRTAPAAPTMRSSSLPVYDIAQWRGVERSKLNGAGVVAAERASGVEVRILGAGRSKVMVAGTAPGPRWCFTPYGDYLMHPGAVAVFEKDGALRMSFGTVETFDRVPDRPTFEQL